MHSGGIWSGDYIVLDFKALVQAINGDCNFRAVTRHRTKELVPPTAFDFPMINLEQYGMPELTDASDDELATDLPPVAPTPGAGGNLTPQVEQGSDADNENSDDGVIVAEDSWEFNGSALTRHHRRPRRELFSPSLCDFPPPVPIDQIDVIRLTLTYIDTLDEKRIDDCWDGTALDIRPL